MLGVLFMSMFFKDCRKVCTCGGLDNSLTSQHGG